MPRARRGGRKGRKVPENKTETYKCSVEKAQKECKADWGHPPCPECVYMWKVKGTTFNFQHKKCKTCIHNRKSIKCNRKHVSEEIN